MSEGGWGPAGTGQPVPGDDNQQPVPGGDHRGSSVRSKIVIGVLAAAVGIAGGALYVGLAKGPSPAASGPSPAASSPSPATTTQVQLEPTSSTGSNPFTTPVGQDQSYITPTANTGGTLSGDTPGLYADTGDKPSCDAQTLIANLEADPAKATAWATALGLQSKDIPTYVPGLTPVVLRSDTAVTSYGYADGRFFPYPAVLQAGTAVFINSYGEPKAKCFSGNPLTQPMSNPQANYVGTAWGGFAPNSVTTVQRTTTVIVNYTFVDAHKGTRHHRPAPWQRHSDDNWPCKHSCGSGPHPGGTTSQTTTGQDATPPVPPNTAGPNTAGPNTAGPNTAGPNTAGPNTAGPNTAGPNTAGPNTAGPNTAGPNTAGPNTAGPNTAGPNTQEANTQGQQTKGHKQGDNTPRPNGGGRNPGNGGSSG